MVAVNNFIPVCIHLFSHLNNLTNITCIPSSQHLERINPKILFSFSVSVWPTQQLTGKYELRAGHYNLNRKEKF